MAESEVTGKPVVKSYKRLETETTAGRRHIIEPGAPGTGARYKIRRVGRPCGFFDIFRREAPELDMFRRRVGETRDVVCDDEKDRFAPAPGNPYHPFRGSSLPEGAKERRQRRRFLMIFRRNRLNEIPCGARNEIRAMPE